MFGFLKVLARNVAKGPSTDPFPFAEAHTPARFRGQVRLDPALCVGCAICHHVCAGGAINITEREDRSGYDFTVWHNTCALCGLCRHYCPTGAITLSNDWHNAHLQSQKYDWCERKFVPFMQCEGCGAHIRPLPPQLAARAYGPGGFDTATFMRLCPSCRQLAAARADMHIPEASAMPAAPEGHADATAKATGAGVEDTPESPRDVKGAEAPVTGVAQ